MNDAIKRRIVDATVFKLNGGDLPTRDIVESVLNAMERADVHPLFELKLRNGKPPILVRAK